MADFYGDNPQGRYPFLQLGTDRKPVVTWTLLGTNVLLWGALQGAGGSQRGDVLLEFGAMFAPYIANGEYWRLFTAIFLHAGFQHLLLNGLGLLIFGRLVERIYGHFRFAFIYLVAGLTGSVASLLVNALMSREAIGVGASGAIFGIVGALAAYFLARRDVLGDVAKQNLIGLAVIAGINIFYGLRVPNIDNAAHIGGLAGGFAFGLVLAPKFAHQSAHDTMGLAYRLVDVNTLVRKWWVFPVAFGVIVAGTLLATGVLENSDTVQAQTHAARAESLLQQRSYAEALAEANEAIRLDPTSGYGYLARGRVFVELGAFDDALSDLGAAVGLEMDPESRQEAMSLLVAVDGLR